MGQATKQCHSLLPLARCPREPAASTHAVTYRGPGHSAPQHVNSNPEKLTLPKKYPQKHRWLVLSAAAGPGPRQKLPSLDSEDSEASHYCTMFLPPDLTAGAE